MSAAEYLADWKRRHPEKVAQYQRERRIRQRQEMLRKNPLKICLCCGTIEDLTRDHIFPLRDPNARIRRDYTKKVREPSGNIQSLCQRCNSAKNDVTGICSIHKKYLGVWNVLPKLDDIEI